MTSIEWLIEKTLSDFGKSVKWQEIEMAKKMYKAEIEKAKSTNVNNNEKKFISDEEIEKFADEELGTIRTDFDFGVIQGMKWYREQLKQKNNDNKL